MENKDKKEELSLPLNICLEKAKNELRYSLNAICNTYNIPNTLTGLLLESLLSEERQQRIVLLTEQSEQLFTQVKDLRSEENE